MFETTKHSAVVDPCVP